MKQNTLQFQVEMLTTELNSQVDNYYNVFHPMVEQNSRKPIIENIRRLQKELNQRIELICLDDVPFLTVV